MGPLFNYGNCQGAHCKFQAPRCSANLCQTCCSDIHKTWWGHFMADGTMNKQPSTHSASCSCNLCSKLPKHYGGAGQYKPEPKDPVLGSMEPTEELILPGDTNYSFRTGTSKTDLKELLEISKEGGEADV